MPPITSHLYDQFTKISLTDWYAVCAVVSLVTWLVSRFAYRCCQGIARRRHVISLRRALCSQSPRLFQQLDIANFPEGFVVALLVTANILPLAVWSRSWMTVQRRAATLAVINLAPLWTGLTFGFPADILGIDRSTLVWSHRWFGRMVAFHSLLHGSIIIATAHNPAESMRRSYVPLLVSRLCQSLPKREPSWSISQRCTIPNIV